MKKKHVFSSIQGLGFPGVIGPSLPRPHWAAQQQPSRRQKQQEQQWGCSVQKRNHLGLLLAIWLLSFSGIVPRYMAGGQYNQKWAAYFWARNSTTQYYIVCYRVSSKTKRELTMLILYERCLLYEKIWTLFLPQIQIEKWEGLSFYFSNF